MVDHSCAPPSAPLRCTHRHSPPPKVAFLLKTSYTLKETGCLRGLAGLNCTPEADPASFRKSGHKRRGFSRGKASTLVLHQRTTPVLTLGDTPKHQADTRPTPTCVLWKTSCTLKKNRLRLDSQPTSQQNRPPAEYRETQVTNLLGGVYARRD